jgi:O-antigen/teichoic acid export membrane protein
MESFRRVASSQALQAALPAFGLILGAELSGLTGALGAFSVGNAAAAGVSLMMLHGALKEHGIRIERSFDAEVWKPMLTLGASAFAAFFVVTAALLLGQLLLAYRIGGYAQVALFNVAFRWHLAVLLLPGALAAVLLPTMTRLGAEGRNATLLPLFNFNIRLTAVVSAIPAALLAISASLVLGLSGPYYSHHLTPVRVLMLAAVFGALNNVLSSASLSLGAVRAWLVSDLVLAAVFFVTAIVVIPLSGATGLALAFLTAYIATDAALVGPVVRRLRARAGPPSACPATKRDEAC